MNSSSKIFIAGHKGLVGSAVYRNLLKHGYKNLFVISKKKLDLKNSEKVQFYLKKNKIEYMVICAALAGGIVANQKITDRLAMLKKQNINISTTLEFANTWELIPEDISRQFLKDIAAR